MLTARNAGATIGGSPTSSPPPSYAGAPVPGMRPHGLGGAGEARGDLHSKRLRDDRNRRVGCGLELLEETRMKIALALCLFALFMGIAYCSVAGWLPL